MAGWTAPAPVSRLAPDRPRAETAEPGQQYATARRRPTSIRPCQHGAIALQRARHAVEQLQPAIRQDGSAVAVLPDRVVIVSRENDVGRPQAFAERGGA